MRDNARSSSAYQVLVVLLALLTAACGGDTASTTTTQADGGDTEITQPTETTVAGTTTTEADAGEACDGFPTQDIEFVVPYSTGGGFDTWARLVGPAMQRFLPNEVNVVVVNREGAGGLVGVTEVFGADPDGHTIAITEPGILATSQISGQTDLDFSEMSAIGQLTVSPEVIVVSSASEWETIEDVQTAAADGPLLMATGGLAAINIVTFDALGIPFDNVVHEGSSEALLSIVRGDTQITIFPLTSVVEGIEGGDLKPLLLVGSEPSGSAADAVADVPLLDEVVGIEGIGAALEQHRIVVAPPGLPQCAIDILNDSIELAFAESGFVTQLEEAGLAPVHMAAPGTQELIALTIDTLGQYEDQIRDQLEGS